MALREHAKTFNFFIQMRARAGAGRSDTQSSPLPTRRQQHRRVATPPLTWALRLVTCVAILLILSLVIIDVLPCFQAASLKQQLPSSRSAAVLHAPPPQPRHTSASKCEIELRLLCVIPIAVLCRKTISNVIFKSSSKKK